MKDQADAVAEKIYNEYGRKGSWNYFDKRMIGAIAAALREYGQEIITSYDNRCIEHSEIEFQRGFRSALEEAAALLSCSYGFGRASCGQCNACLKANKIRSLMKKGEASK